MTDGLADLVLAAYVTVCALAAYRWLEDGGDGWASLSGFAAGAAAWTKLEGALSCLVILAAVLLVRRSLRTPGLGVWLAWLAVFTLPWQLLPADPWHPAQPLALRHALPGSAVDRPPRLARRSPRRRTGACSGR